MFGVGLGVVIGVLLTAGVGGLLLLWFTGSMSDGLE